MQGDILDSLLWGDRDYPILQYFGHHPALPGHLDVAPKVYLF